MKHLMILVMAALVTLTGCGSMKKSDNNEVMRQLKGAGIPGDPILKQVKELEEKKVLKNVVVSESYPVQITVTGPENVLTCLSGPDGRWIEETKECEQMDAKTCQELGGQFNECASACRNNPLAEMCILMCVPVCSFSPKL